MRAYADREVAGVGALLRVQGLLRQIAKLSASFRFIWRYATGKYLVRTL